MQKTKIVISLFFLAFYAMGFIHSMMPHYYHLISDMGVPHEKKAFFHTHLPTVSDKAATHLVHHRDHYDENLFELILCLLDETEHPQNSCHNRDFIVEQVNPSQFKVLSKARLIAVLFSLTQINQQSDKSSHQVFDDTCLYLNAYQEAYPHRGPPSFSS